MTLGEIAFSASNAHIPDHGARPGNWHDLAPIERQRWEMAAQAVLPPRASVRPLEWRDYNGISFAASPFGRFVAERSCWGILRVKPLEKCEGIEQGKVLAAAHYADLVHGLLVDPMEAP